MNQTVRFLRKVVVSVIGFPLLVLGAILVPLPGPGFLVMFVALVLLSTEFDWASRYADRIKLKLKALYDKSMTRAEALEHRTDESGKPSKSDQ